MHLNLRRTLRGNLAVNGVRREYDFRIAVALENILVHSPVACAAAARAARCVHHHRAACFAGARVEVYYSAFQLERAMYRMQDISESEVNRGARGVEHDGLLVE